MEDYTGRHRKDSTPYMKMLFEITIRQTGLPSTGDNYVGKHRDEDH